MRWEQASRLIVIVSLLFAPWHTHSADPSAPVITDQPDNITVSVGGTAAFSISVTGSLPIQFQWQVKGPTDNAWQDIAGAQTDSYTTSPIALLDHLTEYRCNVTNALGGVSSNRAILSLPLTGGARGSQILTITRDGQKLWVANPDNNSVSVFQTSPSLTKIQEINVGKKPRTVALSLDESKVYVACEDEDAMWVVDTAILTATQKIPVGIAPYGVVVNPSNGDVLVTNQHSGTLMILDSNLSLRTTLPLDPDPRTVVVTPDGLSAYVSHLVSRADTGKITHIDLSSLSVHHVFTLQNDPGPDTITSGKGAPNYLTALAVDPIGSAVWYGGLKSNSGRGLFKNGLPLTPDSRLRGLAGLLRIGADQENVSDRIDTNDADSVTAIAFSPEGRYAYLLHQGSGQMSVYDALRGPAFDTTAGDPVPFLKRIDVGDAPQGIVLSPNGKKAYVMNFLSRQVMELDLNVADNPVVVKNVETATEPLSFLVALGKKMFYASKAPAHSSRNYISCFSCHIDDGHDGQTWDFTQAGEGLRSTVDLRGRGGTDHGPVHWSANFDEIQDFENDIVHGFGGTGLAQDGQPPNPPLSPQKNTGRSQKLDALAAYVASLKTPAKSPFRELDGTLTPAAKRGKALFFDATLKCASCHTAPRFTDSTLTADPKDFVLHDVGTLGPGSGQRLSGPLPGLDTPSVLGVWASAPYLHNGSAPTLEAVLTTKNPADQHGVTSNLNSSQIADLVAYLKSLDGRLFDENVSVNAGPDQILPFPQEAQLNGSILLDGQLPSSPLPSDWTMVSGPQPVQFSDRSHLSTRVSFPSVGQYVVELSVEVNGQLFKDQLVLDVKTKEEISRTTQHARTVFNPLKDEEGFFNCAATLEAVSIYNRVGQVVRHLKPQDPNNISWDGKNDDGSVVASGGYFIECDNPKTIKRVFIVK